MSAVDPDGRLNKRSLAHLMTYGTRGIGSSPRGPQEDSPGWDPARHGNGSRKKKPLPPKANRNRAHPLYPPIQRY